MSTDNSNEQLIKERCMAFCSLLAEQALEHPIPEGVMNSVFNLVEAEATGKHANDDDLSNLHSALVGFCVANDYLAHYDKHVLDYMASVMAIFGVAVIEIGEEEDNGESSYLQ